MKGRATAAALGIACFVAVALTPGSALASPVVPVSDQQAAPVPAPHKGAVDLSDSGLRDAVVADSAAGLPNLEARRGGVVVEVVFRPGEAAAARVAIEAAGGDPGITVPGELIQATVPLDSLERLEAAPAVRLVRTPADYSEPADDGTERPVVPLLERLGPLLGEQVQKTNAAAWHSAGYTGQGVKVGIIDSYKASSYNAAVSAGEIPAASGTFCRINGADCSASMFSGVAHGVAVAETVADMAPSAKLYLATANTAADTQAAMNYFNSQGVKIVTRSETGRYDGPGNGTGPIDSVIENSAVGQGMFYLNAAGNSAGRNGELGTYWRGGWTDADADGFIEFAPGDELMGFDCSYLNGLRWSDFGKGSGTTDYDFYLYNSTPALIASSTNSQGASGGAAEPIERIDSYSCPSGGIAYMAVKLYAAGSGTAGDTLEIMTNGAEIEHPQNPFSASGPMADSKSAGAVAVGAVDPALGTTIANYSAEGPTNDNRTKPDLSAAACVKSLTFSPNCFNGTSSATPVTAGAAALALGAGVATTPQALKTYLLGATVDRGAAGTDNVYGRGELRLPAPPSQGDHTPPSIKALKSSGKSGKTAKLRYRVSDDSGESRERVQVVRHGKVLFDATTQFGPAAGGTYFVKWKVPKRIKGAMSFCAVSQDRSGNNSASSCADLKIKKKKKKKK
jgi:Subtilase family